MTVLRMPAYPEYTTPRKGSAFRARRQGAQFRQVQDWTRSIPARPARRAVIAERNPVTPSFSARSNRQDALTAVLVLLLVLFLVVIIADVSALCAGGERIGRLSSGIASLEQSNNLLREEIARAQSEPFIFQRADNGEPERVVILSPAPQP